MFCLKYITRSREQSAAIEWCMWPSWQLLSGCFHFNSYGKNSFTSSQENDFLRGKNMENVIYHYRIYSLFLMWHWGHVDVRRLPYSSVLVSAVSNNVNLGNRAFFLACDASVSSFAVPIRPCSVPHSPFITSWIILRKEQISSLECLDLTSNNRYRFVKLAARSDLNLFNGKNVKLRRLFQVSAITPREVTGHILLPGSCD